ncbi:ceramide phosphoethanolamine synthase [Galendromus occidentalis]|uniref:Ceramide phosphoethanolamine synthase n=1 Tax=Galendromus occidentalis TaxID=34638 RepID=A0AAJ6QXJ0_9ACAR|nr:ceramide phosphoethanolamine synthase [Galendromus occidentalis]
MTACLLRVGETRQGERAVSSSMPGEPRGRGMKVSEHRTTFMVTLGLLLYFLWMDVALYYRIQSLPPPSAPETPPPISGEKPQAGPPRLFSPFTGLSIKMMMLDQVNNYIHTPLANIFSKVTNFSEVLSFISPNMVSFAGFLSACAAARFVMHDSLSMHRLAVFMFCLRTWFDALDGTIARERRHMVQFVSLRNTSGYVVDGVADACGFSVFLIGCFFFLRRKLPTCKLYLPMSQHEKSRASNYMPYSPKRIATVVGCFGLQLAISCVFWDHYISEYHDLLEVRSPQINPHDQSEVLRSSLMWIIMWFWRVSNAHSLMHFFLFFIFCDHMWDFLLWIQYIGLVNIGVLVAFTELHLRSVKTYLL